MLFLRHKTDLLWSRGRIAPWQDWRAPIADDWVAKRELVKAAFVHSWNGYQSNAWGMDEYRPVSGTGKNMIPNGMGWIIVDALDTMMIMNLTDELSQARQWVSKSLNYDQDKPVNVFETTIRMLGGLLSAHYLSQDKIYLEKAVDLADRLLGAFESPTGIPYASVNLHTGKGVESHADNGASSLAEVSSLQLEFKYLTHLTGDTVYWKKAEHVMEMLDKQKPLDGLAPIFVRY